jgi:hypothetical protein
VSIPCHQKSYRIAVEEAALLSKLGELYANYMRRN